MPRLVEDVLETWRAAERLLDELPPLDPDHESVVLAVERLRVLYKELTSVKAETRASIGASRESVARSQALLDSVLRRLDARRTAPAPPAGPLSDEPAKG